MKLNVIQFYLLIEALQTKWSDLEERRLSAIVQEDSTAERFFANRQIALNQIMRELAQRTSTLTYGEE